MTRVMNLDPFFSTNLLTKMDVDVLDIVFGDYFTFLPLTSFTQKVISLMSNTRIPATFGGLTETLLGSALSFLSYLFTRADANFLELPKILEKVEISLKYLSQSPILSTPEYFYALFFVYYLSRVLFLVISNFPENASRALDQVSIYPKLSALLGLVNSLVNAPTGPNENPAHRRIHYEIMHEAQEWIFFFTQIYLETPRGNSKKFRRRFARSEGYYRALFCPTLIDTFFSLLEHPDTRQFGLLHLGKMMKVDVAPKKLNFVHEQHQQERDESVTTSRHKGPVLALYGKFLDYLVQLQYTSVKSKSDPTYRTKRELLLFLLDTGFSEIIDNEGKKRSGRQNFFREMNCFVKLLSLLHDEPTSETERRELGELSVIVLRALMRLIMGNSVCIFIFGTKFIPFRIFFIICGRMTYGCARKAKKILRRLLAMIN